MVSVFFDFAAVLKYLSAKKLSNFPWGVSLPVVICSLEPTLFPLTLLLPLLVFCDVRISVISSVLRKSIFCSDA